MPPQLDSNKLLNSDSDIIGENHDNCPEIRNENQLNTDVDSQGDLCGQRDDNDGYSDIEEAAEGTGPLDANSAPMGGLSLALIKAFLDKHKGEQ